MFCVFFENGKYLTKRNKTSKNIGMARLFETIQEAREAGFNAGYGEFYIGQTEYC